jgi:hypothetical protein
MIYLREQSLGMSIVNVGIGTYVFFLYIDIGDGWWFFYKLELFEIQ